MTNDEARTPNAFGDDEGQMTNDFNWTFVIWTLIGHWDFVISHSAGISIFPSTVTRP